jgi:uncharacterized membrane protein
MSNAKVSAGRGTAWIGQSISLVTARPVAWIGGTAVAIGLTFTLGLIPFIGWILQQLIQFLVIVLAFHFAHAQMRSEDFDLDAALDHTKDRLSRLILMMVISTLLFLICALPVFGALVAAGGIDFLMQQQSSMPEFSWTTSLIIAFGGLVSCIASIVAFAATCFTTPLILFQNQSIGNALRLSLNAVRRNLGALLIFTVLIFLFLALCAIPCGLGLIFGLPTALASLYVVYEELLGKAEAL